MCVFFVWLLTSCWVAFSCIYCQPASSSCYQLPYHLALSYICIYCQPAPSSCYQLLYHSALSYIYIYCQPASSSCYQLLYHSALSYIYTYTANLHHHLAISCPTTRHCHIYTYTANLHHHLAISCPTTWHCHIYTYTANLHHHLAISCHTTRHCHSIKINNNNKMWAELAQTSWPLFLSTSHLFVHLVCLMLISSDAEKNPDIVELDLLTVCALSSWSDDVHDGFLLIPKSLTVTSRPPQN